MKSFSDIFISSGKRGVRVAADLSSYFVSNGFSKQSYKLEDAIESKPSLPISVLCAYDSLSSKVWDIRLSLGYAIDCRTKVLL